MIILRDYGALNLLTALIWGEAEGEPLLGKIAVAWVVKNRAKDPRWPDAYEDVILQRKQFSCFNEGAGRLIQTLKALKGNWANQTWRECRWSAYGVIQGYLSDPTNGSNHYNTVKCDPTWDDKMPLMVTIGNHEFFKG